MRSPLLLLMVNPSLRLLLLLIGRLKWRELGSLFASESTENSWEAVQDLIHEALKTTMTKPPRSRPGKVVFRMQRRQCRLTDEGGETAVAIQAFRCARRFQQLAISPSSRLEHKLQHDLEHCPLLKQLDAQHSMQAPAAAAQQAQELARRYMSNLVKRRLQRWKHSLTDRLLNPTSHLFRWMKQEGPSGPLVLAANGQTLHDMPSVFNEHRRYWEGICSHPNPTAEREYLRTFVSERERNFFLQPEDVQLACKCMNHKSAAGLDCWHPSVVRGFDKNAAALLADFYNRVLETGCWPQSLLSARVSLLPKPQAMLEQASAWRPITVTSTYYRLFAKAALLRCIARVIPHLPEEMLGGLPGRSSSAAVLSVYLWIEQLIRTGQGSLYGISLDASKCFDRISISDAIRAGLSCDIPSGLLSGVASFYLGHQRYTSVRHFLDITPWTMSRGLIQGCSISVLLTCCVLKTWHEMMTPSVRSFSFVDDRLLLSQSSEHLSRTWTASELWDNNRHWVLNHEKTYQFSIGPPMQPLEWNGSS